jgi:hypothetical protein
MVTAEVATIASSASPLAGFRDVVSSESSDGTMDKITFSDSIPWGKFPAAFSVPFDFTFSSGAIVDLSAKFGFILPEKNDTTCASFDITSPV